ncbi:hypothetical protein EHI94_05110 [Cronobacter sakazakii]|nr:hypothetical protein [Cronobacter sakazakii]
MPSPEGFFSPGECHVKKIEDCYAPYVRNFLEDNWDDFVDKLAENYGEDDAEEIAEEIVKALI